MTAASIETHIMPVHVVADTAAKLTTLRAILEKWHAVTCELLGGAGAGGRGSDVVVIATDLRIIENIAALREKLGSFGHVRKRIFLIEQRARLFTVQAYALGATRVLVNPINRAHLLAALTEAIHPDVNSNEAMPGACDAAAAGATALGSMFSAVLTGRPINVARAKCAGSRIADQIAEDGLSSWLGAVRRHHEGSYRHSGRGSRGRFRIEPRYVEARHRAVVFSGDVS